MCSNKKAPTRKVRNKRKKIKTTRQIALLTEVDGNEIINRPEVDVDNKKKEEQSPIAKKYCCSAGEDLHTEPQYTKNVCQYYLTIVYKIQILQKVF